MSDFLRTVAKYSDAQPRWPEGTPVDPATGGGGGRWRDTGGTPQLGSKNVLEGYSEHATLNEKGWIVTSSVDDAVKALKEDRNVELLQPREVSTLLDRLAAIADAAEAAGEKAPVYDLCKVSVKGTNLFCADALDIERTKMPQFIAKPKPGSRADQLPKRKRGTVDSAPLFLEYLKEQGYTVTVTQESAAYLRASQRQLNGGKVGQMMAMLRDPSKNPYTDSPPLLVSEDNYIIDGHHRWAAHVGVDAGDNDLGEVKMDIVRVNIRIIPLLMEANKFVDEIGMTRAGVGDMLGKSWLALVKEWNESEHPRGKTTPESNSGSFAPAASLPREEGEGYTAKPGEDILIYRVATRPELLGNAGNSGGVAAYLNIAEDNEKPQYSPSFTWKGARLYAYRVKAPEQYAEYQPIISGTTKATQIGREDHYPTASGFAYWYSIPAGTSYELVASIPLETVRDTLRQISGEESFIMAGDVASREAIRRAVQEAGAVHKTQWNEADHPRGKTTPESTPGSFAPAGPALSGNKPVTIETFEYKRPGVRRQSKVDVLFNPTATDLKRWAGRDIKQVRWIKWGDNVAMWNAYESTHQQVAEALIRERTATEQDFDDAYWNMSMGFNNGPNVMSGDVELAEILSPSGRDFYDDVLKPEVRKSWLQSLIQLVKDASDWVEAEHPRGKTTPESNSGSFSPKNTAQGELFDTSVGVKELIKGRKALLRDLGKKLMGMSLYMAKPEFIREAVKASAELAKLKAFQQAQDLLSGEDTHTWITAEMLQNEALAPMVEQYLIAEQRDAIVSQEFLAETSELLRKDVAFGDQALSDANIDWAQALDHYIGNGYDEINGYFRGESSIDPEDTDEFKEYVGQFMNEEENDVLAEAQEQYISQNLNEWIKEDERWEALNKRLLEDPEFTQEEFQSELSDLRTAITEEKSNEFYDSDYYTDAMADLEERAKNFAREAVSMSQRERASDAEDKAREIQDLINNRPATPITTIMRRGVATGQSINWDNLKPGDIINFSGFTSMSSKRSVAEHWKNKMIEFVIPAGSKDVLFTTNDGEGEVILNHGVKATVLARTSGRLVVYYHPEGDGEDPDEEVEKADTYVMNFGRLHTEPTIVPVMPVLKGDWQEEEHPRGKTVEGTNKGSFRPSNTGFVSPNIDEQVGFDEAVARQSSERTKLLQSAAQEAADYFNVSVHESVGVGAWADGAEQSLIVSGDGDPEDFKAYMAFMGLIGDQKAVVDFTNDSSGPDTVFRLSVGNRNLKDVHQQLLDAGVQFHTLRQTDHNVDVFVFAPGTEQETTDAVARAAQAFGNIGVAAIRGRGEFVGSWDTREEGRARYEEILDAHGNRVHGHDRGWETLRDRWAGRIASVRKGWLHEVLKWDESQHPRGKSTPESTAGSFISANGRDMTDAQVRAHFKSPKFKSRNPWDKTEKVTLYAQKQLRSWQNDENWRARNRFVRMVMAGVPGARYMANQSQDSILHDKRIRKYGSGKQAYIYAYRYFNGDGLDTAQPFSVTLSHTPLLGLMDFEHKVKIKVPVSRILFSYGHYRWIRSGMGPDSDHDEQRGGEDELIIAPGRYQYQTKRNVWSKSEDDDEGEWGWVELPLPPVDFEDGEEDIEKWDESQHPRGKTTAESNAGSFAPQVVARGSPRGEQYLPMSRRGTGPASKVSHKLNVLFNPTEDELLRWAGRDVSGVRWIKWAGNTVFWEDWAAMHSQVRDALVRTGNASESDFSQNRGYLQGENPVRRIVTEEMNGYFKLFPVRKSWLDTIMKYLPTQPRWPEGTPVDDTTGAGGGRWAPSAEHAGFNFPKDAEGKPIKGEQWRDAQGTPVSPEIAARLKVIPRGYRDVVLNADPTAPCIAIGTDAKDREKRFFSKEWHEGQALKKWEEIKRFNQDLPQIREKVDHALETARGKDLIAAQVIYALDVTGYRIGGGEDELADNDAFGLTTLTSSHVKVNGTKVSFGFPGKKGVWISKTVDDERLATIFRNAKADAKRNQPLLDVSASKVNSYLKELTGTTYSAKDFRTWNGTTVAIIEMSKWKTRPRTEKEFKERQRTVLDKVAAWLGNTRAVAKSSYVDPSLWEWWKV